jgi:hypothetical protein
MLHSNARPEDFIEIVNPNHKMYGFIGRLLKMGEDTVEVEVLGLPISLSKKDVKLRARRGSRTHDEFTEMYKSQVTNYIDELGYKTLIDLALDIRDFEWVKELSERLEALKKE